MTEKEFMEIVEMLNRYIGRFDEEFEYEGYSDHHSHYLYFHKKQPIIVISDRVYKSLLEYDTRSRVVCELSYYDKL